MENGDIITINYTLLWQVFNMVVLYLLIRRFLYKPLSNFVRNRQQSIEENINNAAREREEAEKLRRDYEQKIAAARQEAREIVNQAARQRDEIIAQGKRDAKEQGEQLIAKAKEELQLEKEKVFKELKDELAFISVGIAERIIETKIDAAAQKQLVDRYLEEVRSAS